MSNKLLFNMKTRDFDDAGESFIPMKKRVRRDSFESDESENSRKKFRKVDRKRNNKRDRNYDNFSW